MNEVTKPITILVVEEDINDNQLDTLKESGFNVKKIDLTEPVQKALTSLDSEIAVDLIAEFVSSRKILTSSPQEIEHPSDADLYRLIVENTTEGIWAIDSRGITHYANQRMADMLRVSLEKLTTQSAFDYVFEEDIPSGLEIMQKTVESNGGQMEFRYRRADGSALWALVHNKPVKDENGDLIMLLGMFTDITERKRAEEALKKSEEKYMMMSDLAPFAICLMKFPETTIEQVNVAYERMFGLSRGEAIGKTPDELGVSLEPEGRTRMFAAVLEHGSVHDWELEYATRSGEKRIGIFSFNVIEIGGQKYMLGTGFDITERKRAEDVLARTRIQLEEGQRIAHVGSFEYIAATQETIWSDEECRIYGLEPGSPSPSYAIMLRDFIHPDDAALLDATFSEAMRNHTNYEMEHRIVRPDGVERVVYDLAHPYFDDKGELVKYIGATLDITERKQAEISLRESEERFTNALSAAREGVWDWDMETDEVWYSPRYKEMLGYSEDEIEHHVSAWLRLLHPDDIDHSLEQVESVKRGEREYEVEFRMRHKDGHYLDILSRGFPIRRESDGKIIRIVGTHFDLTERKRAEEALRESKELLSTFLEQSPVGLGLVNNEGKVLHSNAAYRRYVPEVMPSRDPARQPRWKAWDADGRVVAHSNYPGARALRGEKVTPGMEFLFTDDDGSETWTRVSAVPFRASNGEITGCVSSIQDIDQLKRTMEALRESEERFRAVQDNSLDRFTILKPFYNDQGEIVDFIYMYQNAQAAKTAGCSPEELFGRRITEIYPTFTQTRFFAMYKRVMENGQGMKFEERYSNDGVDEWFRATVTPLPDGISVATQIITERKRAEEAVRRSEKRYRMLHESLRDAFVEVDINGQITDFNEHYCQMLGYTPEEVRDLTYQQITPECWHALEDKIVREQIIPRGYSDVYEKEYRRKDGTLFPVELRTILARDDEGQPESMWAIVRNISSRRETEKRLAGIAEREHHIADVLQRAIMPMDIPSKVKNCIIAAKYKPALREAEIGGDFYDIFELDNNTIGIVIGDVAGKGLSAAIRVASARHSIRSYAFLDPNPASILQLANEALCKDCGTDADMLTAFCAVLDCNTGQMVYANAGHEPPIICLDNDRCIELEVTGVPLGVIPGVYYEQSSFHLRPGDVVALVTDGIIEAKGPGHVFYGKESLIGYVSELKHSPINEIADGIMEEAIRFSGGQLHDDAAIVVFSIEK